MPTEIVALIDKPWLLAVVLALGAAGGILVERFAETLKQAERRAYWQGRNSGTGKVKGQGQVPGKVVALRPELPKGTPERAMLDAAEQLRLVMEAQFSSRPLLNQAERRLLAKLDQILAAEAPGWRAMGQVSLGEILASNHQDAYFAINSKRVDLLIIDADCQPLHAVEFQGTGHHLGQTTAARDAVKKEALRRAGIGLVEIKSGDTPAELRALVRKLVAQA